MKKKALAAIAAATLLLCCLPTTVGARTMKGDIDFDSAVTSSDVRLALQHTVSAGCLTGYQQELADINADGRVTTADARQMLLGCVSLPEAPSIPLSGITDVASADGTARYAMCADYTDTYTLSGAVYLSVQNAAGQTVASGYNRVSFDTIAGDVYTVLVKTTANKAFSVTAQAKNHTTVLPYQNRFTSDASYGQVSGDNSQNPLTPATISYQKREGGAYVYSNNPEKLADKDVGQALLRTAGLTDDVYFTYEHSNYTSQSFYLGYQVKNTGDTDVYITVTNAGMQVSGEWLGQQSWSDFYNTKFQLPDDYFVNGEEYFAYVGQDFLNYTPRTYQPVTYRLPAGQYMYVLGGTTQDAYQGISVAGTANQPVRKGRCSNGAVKFTVTGGSVTGTFYMYTDPAQVKAEPKQQGYIVWRDGVDYSAQYKGVDWTQGLIEANMQWTVNDQTPDGRLPVTYNVRYDEQAGNYSAPYSAYNSTDHTVTSDQWMTNLNPQSAHSAVGTDMSVFNCVDTSGNPIRIDNEHADGDGNPANTGNWMINYHDNYTFTNTGDQPRTFRIYARDNGAMMVLIRDKDGKVLDTKCTVAPIVYYGSLPDGADASKYEKVGGVYYPIMANGKSYRTERNVRAEMTAITVQPHTVEQVTLDYLLMGNSSGNITHWATVE